MEHVTYKVTSDPAIEPLTLNELKDRLRITVCDFDREVSDLLTAARKQVEHDAHRRLITQTVAMYLDRFPISSVMEIRTAPIQSITSVQYVDENQATQTFAASRYSTDLDGVPPRIVLTENESWEDTEPSWPQAVTVTFVAGYGATAALVPGEAKLAIVEWCRMHWGKCDGDGDKYRNLINTLAWSGVWKAA